MENSLLLSRARSAVLARDFTLAIRLYRQLLRDKPDDISILNQLGELYMKAGKDDQALPVYKKITEIDKTAVKPFITIGGIYRRLKMYDESIAALEQALVEDGTNAQISYNLGFTYKVMGNSDAAVSCFEEAIELNPDDVLAYNHLGVIHAENGDYEKAVQSYLRGLNIDANHPVLLLNIAKSYEAMGEIDKAFISYEGALRSKPLWVEAVEGYSRLLVKKNRAKAACSLINRALAVNPKDQKLLDALSNAKKYLPEDNNDSPLHIEENIKKTPSVQKLEEPADNSEFDTNGLEINMNEAEMAIYEDHEEEDEPVQKEKPVEAEKKFDFDSMGMDQLANDQPVDPVFFDERDDLFEEEKPEIQNLDDLVNDDEMPVDSSEPRYVDDDAFFSDDEDPSEITALTDGTDQSEEEDTIPVTEQEEAAEEKTVPAEEKEHALSDNFKEELKEQMEKMQEVLDKANYAAEKAWDAAQMAADSAQILDDAAKNLEKEEIEEEQDLETEDEPEIEEAIPEESPVFEEEPELNQEELTSEEENVLDEATSLLPEIIRELEKGEPLENYKEELEMFKKLRELLEYLPEYKKELFLKSRTRLLLDYIIARLSGEPGLYVTVNALIDTGVVKAWMSEEETEEDIETLIAKGLDVVRNLSQFLTDETLKEAINKVLDKIQ